MGDEQTSTSQESPLEDIPLDELLRLALQDRLIDLHVALPARVESYDSSTQTATVTPMINRYVPDGNEGYVSEQLPKIADVPVKFQRCQQFTMSFPLVKGDMGLLVFCERNIGAWRSTGAQSDPGDVGTHTLDGATFVPGLLPDSMKSGSADGANMVIGSETDGNSRIEIKPAGGINLGAGATKGVARNGDKLTASGALAAWAGVVEAAVNSLAPGTFLPANQFAGGLPANPGGSNNMGAISQGSGPIKAVD